MWLYGKNGFLSSPREAHALGIGLYDGFTSMFPTGLSESSVKNRDVQMEPHYAKLGFLLGYLLKIALLVVVLATRRQE